MSASDAAPLPRLGEVFFDVRGESRSMRLSWYADTGVAVFSIWQGGTCTGTFRLPIADLPRMVEALQHGPRGREEGLARDEAAGPAPHRRTPARPSPAEPPDSEIATGQTTVYLPAGAGVTDVTGYHAGPPRGYHEPPPGRSSGSHAAPPPAADYGSGDYPLPPLPAGYGPGTGYGMDGAAGYASGPGPGGYSDEPSRGYHDETPAPDYPTDQRAGAPDAGEYGSSPEYADVPSGPGRYDDEGHDFPGGYAEPGYRSRGSGGYPGDAGYEGYPAEQEYPSYQPEQPYQDYPPDQPYQDYPPEPGFDSPARPYVAGADPGGDEPFGHDRPAPRKPRGRRAAEPAPESFPYGPPPAERAPRQRGRYPGRQ
ncbi:MAG TPA: hypothetical protein VIX86_26665 [Streptosporangiaceae bacterium]